MSLDHVISLLIAVTLVEEYASDVISVASDGGNSLSPDAPITEPPRRLLCSFLS